MRTTGVMKGGAGSALADRVASLPNWIHSIYLGHGVWTPGQWSHKSRGPLQEVLDAVDFTGSKVLDVGCLDGLWTFEAERRGATEVHSIDILAETAPDREPYFRLAAELLGSQAHYEPDLSVYDVAKLGITDFDVVIFMGVYYHLQHPLLAFERLHSVMRPGAVLVVEGQVIDAAGVYAEFFHGRVFQGEPSNRWIPTVSCLREWVESSHFDIERDYPMATTTMDGIDRTGRHALIARAVPPPPVPPVRMRLTPAVATHSQVHLGPAAPSPDDPVRTVPATTASSAASVPRGAIPLPPDDLVYRVTGAFDVEAFESSGALHLHELTATLDRIGRPLTSDMRLLDFGCGCGRLLRHLRAGDAALRLTGVDIDQSAVSWVREHIPRVEALRVDCLPPTPLHAMTFDVIVAYSVFTHLDEVYQDAVLSELLRLVKPEGIVLATVHGDSVWRRVSATAMADAPDLATREAELAGKGFTHWVGDGWETHFPDFYHTTFHRRSYIEQHWSRWFDVVEIVPPNAARELDLVVLRARLG